jgi:cobalt-zinc-cadmium efflux system membrane fusion protein
MKSQLDLSMNIKTTLLLTIFLFFVFAACKKKAESHSGKFCIHDSLISKIRLDSVLLEVVKSEISLNAKISFDQEQVVKIYPLTGGYVETIEVELGDKVQKGQILARISSTDIVNLEKDLVEAEANRSIAERNLSAGKEMYQSGISSQKEYVTLEKEYKKAQSSVNRIQSLLKLYEASDQSHYFVKAPVDGFVVERKINPKTRIRTDNNDYIFTISDLKKVWVLGNVYESDINKVQEGYPVSVSTISYPDLQFQGIIDKVYNVLDAETRAMKVRVKLNNDDYKLKPEMYANIHVTSNENKQMLSIPASATVFDNNKNYVMLFHGRCDVVTEEVTIYKTVGGRSYISSAHIKEGDRIISAYQVLIYDALND